MRLWVRVPVLGYIVKRPITSIQVKELRMMYTALGAAALAMVGFIPTGLLSAVCLRFF